MTQILRNAMRTPDGTILESESVHDCKQHIDAVTGKTYMVDGGRDYIRRSAHDDQEDMSIYLSDDHKINREHFKWGTYGPDGRGPFQRKPLKALTSSHIRAILETQTHAPSWIIELLKKELEYRREFEK